MDRNPVVASTNSRSLSMSLTTGVSITPCIKGDADFLVLRNTRWSALGYNLWSLTAYLEQARMITNKYVARSSIFSTVCAVACLLAFAFARAIDGGPHWGNGSEPFYAMPMVETFAFLTTLTALVSFNSQRSFVASAVWLCIFGTLLLGGGYFLKGHEGIPEEIFHWTMLASIDLVSAMLFAGVIFVFPAMRRRLKKAS
jgi:hypothetical protein